MGEDLGVSLSNLQNEKVDKALLLLLLFKKQVLEDKNNHNHVE